MKIKILVVEDNNTLRENIKDILEIEGYSPICAANQAQAKTKFSEHAPHIVLLDIMLPDGWGYDLIPCFSKKSECRILILTALSDKESIKLCYEHGADDYIKKPFDIDELILKINAVSKRIALNSNQYNIGDIIFCYVKNEIVCNNKKAILQPSQSKFLKALYEKHNQNTYLEKNEIMDKAIPYENESHRIQTLVGRLRDNISYINSKSVRIETIYGKGYRLVISD